MLEEILSKPIEHMILSKKMPPNKEALKLYREILKFSNHFYWNNFKGENWFCKKNQKNKKNIKN